MPTGRSSIVPRPTIELPTDQQPQQSSELECFELPNPFAPVHSPSAPYPSRYGQRKWRAPVTRTSNMWVKHGVRAQLGRRALTTCFLFCMAIWSTAPRVLVSSDSFSAAVFCRNSTRKYAPHPVSPIDACDYPCRLCLAAWLSVANSRERIREWASEILSSWVALIST